MRQSHLVKQTVCFDLAGDGDRTELVLDDETTILLVEVNGVTATKCHGEAPCCEAYYPLVGSFRQQLDEAFVLADHIRHAANGNGGST